MAETEYSGKDVSDSFDVVFSAFAVYSSVWSTGLGCESNRFLDGKGREMDVFFGTVLNIAAVLSSDLLGSQGVVVDITLDIVVGVALVCEHLEECRASGSWAPQHD